MNTNEFANYLLAILIVLQLLNMVIFLIAFSAVGGKSLIPIAILLFIIDAAVLYGVRKIKVYDSKNNPVKSLGNVFGDVIGVAIWTAIASIVLIVLGMLYSIHLANSKGHSKGAAVFLPFLSTIVFYGAFVLIVKT